MSIKNDTSLNKSTQLQLNNYDLNPIKAAYSDYPKTVLVSALLASYTIPRVLDPDGGKNKRPPLKRFFTITLPDNVALATLIVANNIPNLVALQNPPTLLASIFLTGGVCKVLELTRTVVAWGVDKISENQDYVEANNVKDFASFIGPRDFYARENRDD